MPNVALFVGFVTATREARKKHGDTEAPTIVHCRLEMFEIMFDVFSSAGLGGAVVVGLLLIKWTGFEAPRRSTS